MTDLGEVVLRRKDLFGLLFHVMVTGLIASQPGMRQNIRTEGHGGTELPILWSQGS